MDDTPDRHERDAFGSSTSLYEPERHGCGPGESLPADTVTEGARLPRRTKAELKNEYFKVLKEPAETWHQLHDVHQRLADLAGQIAGRTE